MQKELDLRVSPETNHSPERLKKAIAQQLGISATALTHYHVYKRSIDARKAPAVYALKVRAYIDEAGPTFDPFKKEYPSVTNRPPVIVVGAGPAGLFAALRLIELGLRPIVLERGKDVRARRRDLALLNREHVVNPESNYCFGEGGAGTYSDGKLYTRSKKRGDVQRILSTLVAHGAEPDIAVDAHPHIGTNKLPKIIVAMRESIRNAGGEVRFDTKLTDLVLHKNSIAGAITASGDLIEANHLILATGHSARDIFELLDQKGIRIEAKPFALGLRIEHPQQVIDRAQYKCADRGDYLPPAAYSLVEQVKGKGVYSFCMCPGGIIAPCATAPGEVVTNGWSPSRRNNPFANSGIVVSIEPDDWKGFTAAGPLAALRYQQAVEQAAWVAGGRTQAVPAQRMLDFIKNRTSNTLPASSYQPGIKSVDLKEVLPKPVAERLQLGLKAFGNKLRGYGTNDAVLHAVESRTSSPVRIPRDRITLEHPEIAGLYPCGEGAGFAGGIVSAAIDGEKCAERCAQKLGVDA